MRKFLSNPPTLIFIDSPPWASVLSRLLLGCDSTCSRHDEHRGRERRPPLDFVRAPQCASVRDLDSSFASSSYTTLQSKIACGGWSGYGGLSLRAGRAKDEMVSVPG
jgi:hypothetical protein